MLVFIVRRILLLFPMLFALSLLSFVIIQLPPGSYVDTYAANLRNRGLVVDQTEIDRLNQRYGLDKPLIVQYVTWMKNFLLNGDLGESFQENRPVADILKERVPLTIFISVLSIALVWLISIPIGIYSATNQYSLLDYVFAFVGMIGLALPSFLLAIILM